MVYDKAKSGDPDYDDKVPMEDQVGKIVTAGSGREVLITEANGPVDRVTGQHVSLQDPQGDAEDNRPAPGDVATESSAVQTYTAEDTAIPKQSVEDLQKEEDQRRKDEDDKQSSDKLETEDVPRPRQSTRRGK